MLIGRWTIQCISREGEHVLTPLLCRTIQWTKCERDMRLFNMFIYYASSLQKFKEWKLVDSLITLVVATIRSAARGDLAVPATRTLRYGPRSFAVAGPSTWNFVFQHRYAAANLHPRIVVIWKLNCLSERITTMLVAVSSCKNRRT